MGQEKKKHDRQSIRLKGYDYSHPGFYFITICTQNRRHIFGRIQNGKMILNDFGEIVWDYWNQIESRYPNARIDEFIIMPNHMHGIIEIINPSVRAIHESPIQNRYSKSIYKELPVPNRPIPMDADIETIRKYRRKMLIPKIVGWYKMNTAKRINQITQTPGTKIWQRNYYDHIIRNEQSLYQIREYIKLNPKNWGEDRFYK